MGKVLKIVSEQSVMMHK